MRDCQKQGISTRMQAAMKAGRRSTLGRALSGRITSPYRLHGNCRIVRRLSVSPCLRVSPSLMPSAHSADKRSMSANFSRYRFCCLTAAICLPYTAWAATIGTVVAIGGQGSDLALDEPRGVLYIANFTANLIEQMSLKDNSVHPSISGAAQPGALALSQDDQYLVIAHYGAWTSAAQSANALTIIHLPDFAQRVLSLSSPPLGVAFGADGQALVVTTTAFLLLNPSTGATSTLGTISDVTAHMLPVQPPNFPTQIVAASMAASGDGWHMYGLTDTFQFSYDVQSHWIGVWAYTSTPTMGPRVLSVSQDGSTYTAGWALFNAPGNMVAQFANPSGALNIGSTVIDSAAGLIYAQIPQAVAAVR